MNCNGQVTLKLVDFKKEFNNSTLSDLFQGQLKIKIISSICKWGYISYPYFYFFKNSLSNKDETIKVKIFNKSNLDDSLFGNNELQEILDD